MILALFIFGLLLLGLPGLLPRPPRRLPIGEWTITAFAATVVGAFAVLSALALAAAPIVAAPLGVSGVVDHCRAALAPLADDSMLISWVAGGIASFLGVRIARAVTRSVRSARNARVEPWLGVHHLQSGVDIVELPTDALVAYGIGGRRPQVVLSAGLVDCLSTPELVAVIAHEEAHLRLRHPMMLGALSGIDAGLGAFRFVGATTDRIRAGLELWADDAAERDAQIDRASMQDALARVTASTTLRSGDTTVRLEMEDRARRMREQIAPRPMPVRMLAYAPVLLLTLTAAMTLIGWFTNAHDAVAFGANCA